MPPRTLSHNCKAENVERYHDADARPWPELNGILRLHVNWCIVLHGSLGYLLRTTVSAVLQATISQAHSSQLYVLPAVRFIGMSPDFIASNYAHLLATVRTIGG